MAQCIYMVALRRLDLAADRIFALVSDPAIRLRFCGLDDFLDELLSARVRLVEAIQTHDAGRNGIG